SPQRYFQRAPIFSTCSGENMGFRGIDRKISFCIQLEIRPPSREAGSARGPAMASNATVVSGLAPPSTTDDVPDVSPLTKGQVTYTAIVALLAWTFAVYDLITFGNLLPKI